MENERQEEQTEAQEQEIKDLDVQDDQMDEIKGGRLDEMPKE
jgi:hypothetical protein